MFDYKRDYKRTCINHMRDSIIKDVKNEIVKAQLNADEIDKPALMQEMYRSIIRRLTGVMCDYDDLKEAGEPVEAVYYYDINSTLQFVIDESINLILDSDAPEAPLYTFGDPIEVNTEDDDNDEV